MIDTMFNNLLANIEQTDHFINNEGIVDQSKVKRITEFAPLEVKSIRAKASMAEVEYSSRRNLNTMLKEGVKAHVR